ncbi:hypothetical protein LJR045_001002 [Microbacterium sp. LjRoot45]|uniref:hypothetical protein n=1 Tax=Microbacterium sp. LjRoot45 TaxID=3342329 RepID=UPI003ED1123F
MSNKDLKILFSKLEAQGWEIRPTKKGQFAVPPDPSKPLVQIHNTARGSRSWQNMMAQLKRSGFDDQG